MGSLDRQAGILDDFLLAVIIPTMGRCPWW